MKYFNSLVGGILLLTLVGCGPSAEQKKMVADLTSEVTTMVDNVKNSLARLDNISGEVTAAIAGADSLAQKNPKDTAAISNVLNQLKSAKDRVMSVKDNVNSWIAAFKVPDLATMDFDKVMAQLKQDKEQLTTATSEIEGALTAANTALDGYKNLAANLMTRVAAKKKK